MKLKKVEIQGFKTFVDRTLLHFNAGITGVVGPNGCGKSNIVDAIRWILGENNPRTLRGATMDDIIFNGSETRPPLGMAEVTLTLDNQDGSAAAQYSAHSEIAVCRRVFRDGESEYLINKIPCRLKDITDFFLGTGANFYSIVEQGKISSIVSAKPEELRTFIEEAAGITFYRARKRAALRRIEATQHNLVRVSDILSEISRQIRYLERQARKAEKYRQLRDRLRLLELAYGHRDLQEMHGQVASLNTTKETLEHQRLGFETANQSVAAKTEELRLELHGVEAKVQEAQRQLYEAGKSLAEQEKHREFLLKERTDLTQRQLNLQNESERSAMKLAMTEEQLTGGAQELTRLKTANAGYHENVQTLENDFHQLEEELSEQRQVSESLQEQLMEQWKLITTLKTKIDSTQLLSSKHSAEQETWLSKREGLAASISKAAKTLEQLTAHKANLEKSSQSLEQQLQTQQSDLSTTLNDVTSLTTRRDAAREERAETSAKLESMLALDREGTVEQFVSLSGTILAGNLIGKVSQLIRVPKELERAVEAYLGERLNALVVNDAKHPAHLMLKIMDQQNVPRATLIPLSIQDQGQSRKRGSEIPTVDESGVVGRMVDKIQSDAKYTNLIHYLCGDVIIVQDLHRAAELAPQYPDLTWVTVNGEMIVANTEVSGGQMGESHRGVLHRQRQVVTLRQRLAELPNQIQELESALQKAIAHKNQVEKSNQTIQEQLQAIKLQHLEAEKDYDRLFADQKRQQYELQQLDQQLSSADSSYQALLAEREQNSTQLVAAETLHQELKEQVATSQQTEKEWAANLATAQEAWTQARVENASAFEREEFLTQEQLRLKNDLESLKVQTARLKEEHAQLVVRDGQNQQEVAVLEKSLRELRDQVVELERNFQSAQRSYQEFNAALQSSEMSRREAESEVHRLQREIAECDFKQREVAVKRDHLRQHLIEKWKVDLEAVVPETIELSDETQAEMESLRESMESMGEVNLGAVEEHAFLKDRFDFLSAQRTDLEQSIDALQKTIRKIDATTKQLFFEAFDGINKELKIMFPRLFSGGKAELVMVGDETVDPLERGMSIIAHPPGKRPQHINLLSGGEKSLTAAALIFAIFKFKPAPFSILDEIDAALDDENTRRLNRIAQEIAQSSQLVIITHNKRTMEVAQNLYGITMEEAGISKVVSVKLEDPHLHQQVSDQTQAAVA